MLKRRVRADARAPALASVKVALPRNVYDQRTLADTARALVAKGVQVMLSNSDTPFIRSIYKGFAIDRVKCPRAINSNAAKRGDVDEVIIVGGYDPNR